MENLYSFYLDWLPALDLQPIGTSISLSEELWEELSLSTNELLAN